MRTSGCSARRARAAPRLHARDQLSSPRRVACAVIDDEVGVLLDTEASPMRSALQARGLDEPRGVIARRVGEYRAAAPLPDRLRRLAPLEQLVAPRSSVLGRPCFEAQLRRQEPLLRQPAAPPDGSSPGTRSPARRCSRPPRSIVSTSTHVPPGLTAEGAGVHRQRSAQRARECRRRTPPARVPT